MCTSCRAVGYWFPDEGGCADCRAPMTDTEAAEARAEGYGRGDLCPQCRADVRRVLAVLRGDAPTTSPIGEAAPRPAARPVQLDLFLGAA